VTIQNGNAGTGNGGGINNSGTLTLSNCVLSGNSLASFGGGIYNNYGGTVTVTSSSIEANLVGLDGGGIYNGGTMTVTNSTVSGNSSSQGAGIFNNGMLTVSNSTVSGNFVGVGGLDGGGLYTDGGTVNVTNSTFSGNAAAASNGSGGGLYHNGGTVNVSNSTLSGNSASSGGGIEGGGTLIKNSIVANSPSGGNCNGEIISEGYNLVDDASCGLTQKTDFPSTLAGLANIPQNNGGPTLGRERVAIGIRAGAGGDSIHGGASARG
jgi:hypothetical protein